MAQAPWGRFFIFTAFLTGLALGAAADAPDKDNPADDDGVVIFAPPGFTTAAQDDRTQVDIYLNGRKVAQTPARFNADTLTFEDPYGLADLLPSLRDTDRVGRALSRPLPTHADMSCRAETPPHPCGYVYPDDVALIFDRDILSAELFLNDLYTFTRDPRARFLPPPTVSPGLITSFDTRTNYDFDRDRWLGTHNVRAIAGKGRTAVRADLFANTNGYERLTSLYSTHTGDTRAWSLGLQPQSYGGTLSRSRQLLGFRIGSTLDTRLDRQRLSASALEISVSQSATVEIQRDGRTLDVQQVEPGQTELDTSRLPQGAYTVDLVIDEGGTTRTETRYFSTSSQLPPADTPQWYVELGQAIPLGAQEDFIATGETPVLAFGRHQRIGANWALQADATISDATSFAELGGQLQLSSFSGSASVLAADDGTFGYTVSGNAKLADWQIYGSYRKIDIGSDPLPFGSEEYEPFPNSFEQASLSASTHGRWGRAGLRGFYRKSSTGLESWFGGPQLDFTLLDHDQWRLTTQLRYEWGTDRETSFVGLRLTKPFRQPTPWMKRAYMTARVDNNRTENTGTGQVTERTVAETELRSDLFSDPTRRLDAFVGLRHEDELGARAGINYSTPWLTARFDARHDYQNQNSALIDARSGFAWGASGLSLTATREESGVQMRVDGPPGNSVGLQVDRRRSATARSASHGFVPVRSFDIHDIGIQPDRTQDLTYDQATDRVVAYPGNVIQLRRTVRPVTIIIGQLVDADGAPVAEALLRLGEDYIGRTGPDGSFQIDAAPGDALTVRMAERATCAVTVPLRDADDQAAYFDTGRLVCD